MGSKLFAMVLSLMAVGCISDASPTDATMVPAVMGGQGSPDDGDIASAGLSGGHSTPPSSSSTLGGGLAERRLAERAGTDRQQPAAAPLAGEMNLDMSPHARAGQAGDVSGGADANADQHFAGASSGGAGRQVSGQSSGQGGALLDGGAQTERTAETENDPRLPTAGVGVAIGGGETDGGLDGAGLSEPGPPSILTDGQGGSSLEGLLGGVHHGHQAGMANHLVGVIGGDGSSGGNIALYVAGRSADAGTMASNEGGAGASQEQLNAGMAVSQQGSTAGGAISHPADGGAAAPLGGSPLPADGSDPNDGTDPDDESNSEPIDEAEQGPLAEICDPQNSGDCDCSTEEGFTTYTVTVEDQQRCFTVYIPPGAIQPLPALMTLNCYARNQLQGLGCTPGSDMIRAANAYGFAAVCASSTDGNWAFGNDGVINDENPTPCSNDDSKEMSYLRSIWRTLDGLDHRIDRDAVYAWGFSQNAMFAAYSAICFPNRIAAFWQGGSGLFVRGETAPLPQMEGVCRRSDFVAYGRACQVQSPCDECQYFPAYPVASSPPLRACVMAYADDYLQGTARPMYERLLDEGHDATLLSFPDVGRGHSNPIEAFAWLVGCLEIKPQCTAACGQSFAACVSAGGDRATGDTDWCGDTICDYYEASVGNCPRDCGPNINPNPNNPCNLGRCPCGDGVCDSVEQGNPNLCPRDCQGSASGRGNSYQDCFDDGRYSGLAGCVPGCAPNWEMLRTSETPTIEVAP